MTFRHEAFRLGRSIVTAITSTSASQTTTGVSNQTREISHCIHIANLGSRRQHHGNREQRHLSACKFSRVFCLHGWAGV